MPGSPNLTKEKVSFVKSCFVDCFVVSELWINEAESCLLSQPTLQSPGRCFKQVVGDSGKACHNKIMTIMLPVEGIKSSESFFVETIFKILFFGMEKNIISS